MKALNRKETILSLLRNYSRFVTVEQLSKQLFVSGATIRRDLSELAESGQVQRTRGGAILLESISSEAPLVLRENRNEMQKQIISSIARPYIKDGMTLFMDSSTTVFTLARNLEHHNNLRIITNNLKIIWLLSERKGIEIICTGGVLHGNLRAFLGESAVKYTRSLNADAAFVSCQGFTIKDGSSDSREEEYSLKNAYMDNSAHSYLLFDTSKMDQQFLHRTAPASAFTRIITESREVNDYIASSVASSVDNEKSRK